MVQVAGLIVNHSAGFCFIMPRGVVILNHAGGSTLSFRGYYCLSCRAVLNHHAGGLHHHSAVLIAYQEAGTWFR